LEALVPARLPIAALLALLLAATATAQINRQLPFPLASVLSGAYEASGGLRAWAGLRDLSILQIRRQLEASGKVRASEEIRIFVQNVPQVRLLMQRQTGDGPVYQGWRRDEAWMVEHGLRVRNRARLEAARRELHECLLLDRLPFSLTEAVTGELAYEGEFGLGDHVVRRLRYSSGEYPGGEVRVMVDSNSSLLRALGFFSPEGGYQEVSFRRWSEEHGVRVPWLKEFWAAGRLVRQDEIREFRVNQWFSAGVFEPEAWLRRSSR
jgi:hypothetical protein